MALLLFGGRFVKFVGFLLYELNIAVTWRVQKLQTVTQAHCADEAEDGNF